MWGFGGKEGIWRAIVGAGGEACVWFGLVERVPGLESRVWVRGWGKVEGGRGFDRKVSEEYSPSLPFSKRLSFFHYFLVSLSKALDVSQRVFNCSILSR